MPPNTENSLKKITIKMHRCEDLHRSSRAREVGSEIRRNFSGILEYYFEARLGRVFVLFFKWLVRRQET